MFLIVTGGEPPSRSLITGKASRAEWIVAADRGAQYCLDAGILPDLVVGDMDSLDETVLQGLVSSNVPCSRFSPCKDRTDTEIAMEETLRRGARHIEILGAVGDRIDHTLANVHLLLAAMRRGVQAVMVSDSQQIFLACSRAVLENSQGCVVSFLPLTERVEGIVLEGFAYGLLDAVMEIGRPYGVSNIVTEPRASVRLRRGVLLAVLIMEGYREDARVVTEPDVGVILGRDT